MAQATIMTQQVDANNDPIEGPNGPVFLSDIQAVAQIIGCTLRLLLGEWWEDLSIGFPLFQKVIGASGSQAGLVATQTIIQNAVLGCPYVLQILSFSYTYNSGTRFNAFTCTASTSFGNVTVTNLPGSSATVVTT